VARTGRRPGISGSREAILAAARTSFADQGYDGTTIRGIARHAGVDPALVRHYFGTKEQLFAAALEFPFEPAAVLPTVLGDGLEGAGERLRWLSNVFPLSCAVDGMQRVTAGEPIAGRLTRDLVVIGLTALVALGLGAATLRRVPTSSPLMSGTVRGRSRLPTLGMMLW
jgi:AcrR family transcriptional regulator